MDFKTSWRRVLERDARFDGAFVYAVRSTGVYCRPSCPSRRPRREQVVFFPLPEAAERAGFRPCRRCKPHEAVAKDSVLEKVRSIRLAIDAHPEEAPALADLAARLGGSPFHLARAFKRVMGLTPRQYRQARRLELLKTQLKESKNVTHALYEAGYGSSSRLYERANERLGMTPGVYRRGGKGMTIRFSTVKCPVGRLLVAATERGIARVMLGDDARGLEEALRKEFPAARIERDGESLGRAAASIVGRLEGGRPTPDLPIDIRGTAFQWRVWEELRRIPRGATRSYSEIARAIGRPRTTRAVARACATNPVALIIPCHRVVRKSGKLGGYRWGTERKKALLEREGARSA